MSMFVYSLRSSVALFSTSQCAVHTGGHSQSPCGSWQSMEHSLMVTSHL